MNRKHTSQYWQVSHQQRASLAGLAKRLWRRSVKPLHLWYLKRQLRSADEHMTDVAATREMMHGWLVRANDRCVHITAQIMRVERDL